MRVTRGMAGKRPWAHMWVPLLPLWVEDAGNAEAGGRSLGRSGDSVDSHRKQALSLCGTRISRPMRRRPSTVGRSTVTGETSSFAGRCLVGPTIPAGTSSAAVSLPNPSGTKARIF